MTATLKRCQPISHPNTLSEALEDTLRRRRRQNLKRLFRARSIAFVGGASAAGGIRYCRALGFDGDVWAVNPGRSELEGVPCVARVADLPGVPDATWIAVPPTSAIEIVRDLNAIKAPAAVCYTAGFSESGNRELERQLVEAAGDMAVVGPNCIGAVNYLDGIPVAIAPGLGVDRPEHGVALIAQSGTIIGNMTSSQRSLPVSHLLSMGNQSILDLADGIDAVTDDPRVDAILLYIEGLKDAAAFARAARRAFENGKTLIALKGGTSETGRMLALSHTGSLAGSTAFYEAFFKRLGIVSVRSFPELLEMSKLFAFRSVPEGNRLMVETASGTDSGYCADLAETHGVALPQPDEQQRTEWADALPSSATPINPVDVTMLQFGDREAQANTLLTMLNTPADAAALVINYLSEEPNADWDSAVLAMIDVRKRVNVPCFVITNLPEGAPHRVRELLLANDVVPLQGMEDALSCIGQAARYAMHRQGLSERGGPRVELVGRGALQPGLLLGETRSKRILGEYGVPVSASLACPSAEVAVEAARKTGYPVVLKVQGDGFAHKTELGGVALDLRNDEAVAGMANELLGLPGAGNVTVESMVTDAVAEMIVGITRDPTLGLGLTIGTGGIFAEILQDSITLLLPVTRDEIRDALQELRGAVLLNGYRGRPVGDTQALVEAVAAIASAAESQAHQLLEMEVNPLLVRPQANGVVAVDALIRWGVPAP